ncbi:hypothetical protein ABMA27_012764 [Loxostege sticticalis]|uniref:Peptidase S1 domain-containing protein n=1 Tax=Loxostege sticticalis TaxID=481309 RepID=A0ABR3GZQ3_LOXSC
MSYAIGTPLAPEAHRAICCSAFLLSVQITTLLRFVFLALKGGRQECTVKGEPGACVASRGFCKTPHTGAGEFMWRASTRPCPDNGVCCKLSDIVPANTDTTSTTSTTTTASPAIGSRVRPTAECGIQKRQTVPDFMKTRDDEADPGEFPWTVYLMIKKINPGSGYSYTGTGSLIHDRVVLTSAFVLRNKDLNNLYAVFGEHEVGKRILHDGNYNFALAFLKSSATANLPHVGTVCLPPAGFVASAGASCVFSGWGIDPARKIINQLTKTEVPMMEHSTCEERLRQSPQLGPGFQLLESLTCAGGEVGKDICTAGGGSPLVCPIEGQNRYVQTGILSWVMGGCGVDGTPVVFADVAVARSWIDQQMAVRVYSTSSYTY